MADKQSKEDDLEHMREEADGSLTFGKADEDLKAGDAKNDDEGDDDDVDNEGAIDSSSNAAGDDAGGEGGDEPKTMTVQERRRLERAEKKRRQKEREDRLERENRALADQVRNLTERQNVLEKKDSGKELAQIEAAISQADQAEAYYKQQMADAIAVQNGEVAVEASAKMHEAKNRAAQLKEMRAQRTRQVSQQRAPLEQRKPPPELVNQAQAWMAKNTWYDPANGDDDSAVLALLDERLGREGRFDPRTAEYWQELSKRASKVLPHRFQSGTMDTSVRKPARSPSTGSGREAASSSGGGEFKVSAERVQALKDAGMWNDLKVRAAAIKDFRDYDRKAAAEARSNGGSR